MTDNNQEKITELEAEGLVYVSAIKPTIAMSMVENDSLVELAQQAEQRLENVINNI